MKRAFSAFTKAGIMGAIAGAMLPIQAAVNSALSPAPRSLPKAKTGRTPADKEAIAKAEAKRARRANRNKDPK